MTYYRKHKDEAARPFPFVIISRVSRAQQLFIHNKTNKDKQPIAHVMREIIQYYMDNHND